MASNAFINARDEGLNWDRHPYGVGLGQDFESYKDELKHQLSRVAGEEGSEDSAQADAIMKAQAGDNGDIQFMAPSVGDSSIFGNDVMNPYAGFCRDDDIVHQSFAYKKDYVYGMGRVYAETYDSKQQVMYLQFGIPKYRNLRTYLSNATDGDMAELNDNGEPGIASKLGSFIKKGLITAVKLPWLPLEWGYKAIDGLDQTKVTEYFYFKECMMLYWRQVNGILAQMAVAMGLYGPNAMPDDELPEILKGGPDIFYILSTRSRRYDASLVAGKEEITPEILEKSLQTDPPTEEGSKGFLTTLGDWWDKFWNNVWSGTRTSMFDSNKFLAFRIEKGSDNASENFSNSIQPSALQQRLNGLVDQQRNININENQGDGLLEWVNRKIAQGKSAINNVKNAFSSGGGGVNAIIEYAAAGNGFFDLPQQWCGSNFSRSVSVNIRLRSKTGGDPVSIYTSIIIPLSCLLAGAMPRASGDGTYTSPFICRCWCRGMFAVPAGIIQSLNVTRGDSEFGWSLTRLPTTVAVSLQIADLSPIMFLGLAGDGAWQQAWANNTKLQEYLNTIAGIGLKQRYYLTQQLRRNYNVWKLIHKNTTLSATYWGMRAGDSWLGRTVSLFAPIRAMRVGS